MLKKLIIFLTLILSLYNLSLATSKTYTLTKDYGYLSFDGVVLTPPQSVQQTLWERDETPLPESFLNKYKNSKGTSAVSEENSLSVMNCPREVEETLWDLYQKSTNYHNPVYFPSTNVDLCPSLGDYPVENAYEKAKTFLKDFNPNFNYYLYCAVGITTDMVNQAIEDIKKDKENEHFIKKGKIGINHLNFFKTYYRFSFNSEYKDMLIFNGGSRVFSLNNMQAHIIVSKYGIEYVDLPQRVKFKEEGNPVALISLEQALERLNKLEEIKAKSNNAYYSKINYFKAELGWGLMVDDYGNSISSGEAVPLWRFGYLNEYDNMMYDHIDARTGELFLSDIEM